jgi:hypothetical protein
VENGIKIIEKINYSITIEARKKWKNFKKGDEAKNIGPDSR